MTGSVEGWLHPYLFMIWMGKISLPQWLAAAGSLTASVVALHLSDRAGVRELAKERRELLNKRKVAAVGLDQAGTYIRTIIQSLEKRTLISPENLRRWISMARDAVDFALKQQIPDPKLLNDCFYTNTLLQTLEEASSVFGGPFTPQDQATILEAFGAELKQAQVKLEEKAKAILAEV